MRFGLLFLVAVVVAGFSIAISLQRDANREAGYGRADIGGEFQLIDQNGQAFTDNQLNGHVSLVYFGFTHCPDICPVALTAISDAIGALGLEGEKIIPVFITVDPKRDTPKTLKAYAANFHPRLIALTGDEAALARAQAAYKVYASAPAGASTAESHHEHEARHASAAYDYNINHSGYIYLMGPEGQYITHFPHDAPAVKITEALRGYLRTRS